MPGPRATSGTCSVVSVHEEAVHRFAMLIEAFTVVGGDDQQRVVAQTRRTERSIEPADELVRPGDFAVVEPIGIARRVGFRRFVRIVRIVQMHPGEAPIGAGRTQPRDRPLHRFVTAFLNRVQKAGIVFADLECVLIRLKPAIEAGLFREHDGRHECGRAKAGLLQDLREDRDVLAERRRDVVANAVLARI